MTPVDRRRVMGHAVIARKKVVSDRGHRWVTGRLPADDYFDRAFEEKDAEAREEVGRWLERRPASPPRRPPSKP
jgi:hypothetical protein